jgi:hypothetical protein
MTDPDIVNDVIPIGWGERVRDSFGGILVGLLLFVGSFFLLAWNEGRALDAMDRINLGAKLVKTVGADRVDPAFDGKLIHLSGTAQAPRPLVDRATGVSAPNALRLRREVEMYQWTEHKSDKQIEYRREWSSSTHDSSSFKAPQGHQNPPFPFKDAGFVQADAPLGAFVVDQRVLDDVHPLHSWPVPDGTQPAGGFRVIDGQLYRGGDSSAPKVGDVRVSYEIAPAGPLTVVAGQTGNRLLPFTITGDGVAYARTGTFTAAEMFQFARDEERILTWVLRGLGAFLMWLGVVLVFRPLAMLVSAIPFLGEILDAGIALAALIITLPLSIGTIAIAWLAYRPVLAIGVFVVALALAWGIKRLLGGRKAAPAATTS